SVHEAFGLGQEFNRHLLQTMSSRTP
ncbi:TPA: alkylmercury lyase, partial [Escherichia coli]|nr:alkylmercury lyase [Vibrio parahaemolyticus]HCP4137160.1 alkylmercury lyase [Escherichia coli]